MLRRLVVAPPPRGVILRLCLVVFGCASVVWSVTVLPVLWRDSLVDRVPNQILAEEIFKPANLITLLPRVERAEDASYCRPSSLRGAAIVRLRIFEDTVSAGERQLIEPRMGVLRQSLLGSLACSPADAFLWLVLFWIENAREGFKAEHVKYLYLSYSLGPNEGWIALKRIRIALSIFEQLPTDTQDMAIQEFMSLLNSGFINEMVDTFVGPGWRVRDQLLPGLNRLTERNRQAFALVLYKLGYNVDVPGVDNPEPRPWH